MPLPVPAIDDPEQRLDLRVDEEQYPIADVLSACEDDFKLRHASAALSRGSLDTDVIEDAIRNYNSGVENAGLKLN